MTARIRRTSRLPPPKWRARTTAFLATVAAATTISGAATISGATAESVLAAPPATSPSASPAPSPAVPPSALLPPEALPAAARDGFDLRAAMSASGRKDDGTECGDIVHGRLVTAEASGQGFQSAVPGGQVSELVARTTTPPDLAAWAARAARCAEVTVEDPAGTAVSTITVRPGPAEPGTKSLSYEQLLTLPGQPPELPGLRLRTVAIAAADVLVLLRDAGSTGVDLDTLAVTAWRHAANRLGR